MRRHEVAEPENLLLAVPSLASLIELIGNFLGDILSYAPNDA